jgi:hypothetical protein
MDLATIALIEAGLGLAARAIAAYPAIRESLSTTDQARLDTLYAEATATRNAIADDFRNTPDKG